MNCSTLASQFGGIIMVFTAAASILALVGGIVYKLAIKE